MSHCIEIISLSFSILSSVESASIPCTSSIECYQEHPVFLAKIAIVTHGLFRPKVVAGHVGSAHKTIIVCWKIYLRPIGE